MNASENLVPWIAVTTMSSPPPEHIWLFIESVPTDPEALYLEIPLNRIRANCSKPAKYLLFIAYAITALDGTITLAPQNQLIADDNQLEDQAIYIFNPGEWQLSEASAFLNGICSHQSE